MYVRHVCRQVPESKPESIYLCSHQFRCLADVAVSRILAVEVLDSRSLVWDAIVGRVLAMHGLAQMIPRHPSDQGTYRVPRKSILTDLGIASEDCVASLVLLGRC